MVNDATKFNTPAHKTEFLYVHVAAYVYVYVYIDFPEIGIDAYAGRRLIVEQLLVNAPLFPFSVRSAR